MWIPAAIEVEAEADPARAPPRTRARSIIRVVFIGHLVLSCGAGRVERFSIPGGHHGDCSRQGYRARTMPGRFPGGAEAGRPAGRTGVRPGADGFLACYCGGSTA